MTKSKYLVAVSAAAILFATPAYAQSQSVSMSGIVVEYSGEVSGDGEFSGATVEVSGIFGGDLEVSGASVEINADVGGDLDASGGAVDVSGTVGRHAEISGGAIDLTLTVAGRTSISGGAIDVYRDSVFNGDVDISVGAMEFAGHAMGELEINFGDMEFSGRADRAVDFDGNSREGIFRRRDRSEIELSGILEAGGHICAHEVRFLAGAEINGPLTIYADDVPTYASGVDSSNVSYVQRERERCRDED